MVSRTACYCDGIIIRNLCIPRGTLLRIHELQDAGILPKELWAALRKAVDIVYQAYKQGKIRFSR